MVKYHFNDIVDLPLLFLSFFVSFDRNKIKNVANSKNILQFRVSNFIFNIRRFPGKWKPIKISIQIKSV